MMGFGSESYQSYMGPGGGSSGSTAYNPPGGNSSYNESSFN